jgi:hypothetical protein
VALSFAAYTNAGNLPAFSYVIISNIQSVSHAFSRADIAPEKRRLFYVYIDEFQSFTTLALVNMFSELRKYRVSFTVAHQYLNQLEPEIRHAVFGNVGTIISFRVGAEDAPYIVQEFHEQQDKLDFLQLPNYRIYLKLMINGSPSKPFSAATFPPDRLVNILN